MEEAETAPTRHTKQKEWDQRHRHAWDALGFSRVRQQHLVNLEALAREQLLRHDWESLPASLAALLAAQDPQLNEKGEAGIPGRAARNAFVLDAARELLPHAQGATAMQQQRLVRLASEQAEGAAEKEGRRLEVAVLAAAQGDTNRAYDLLSAPVVGQWAKPDAFTRACLAGQLKHATWAQGMEHAARQTQRRNPSTALPHGLLYTHDPAIAHALDSRTIAAAAAAEKHLQEAVALQPGATLPAWLLFQLLAAGGRASEAVALARSTAAAAPDDADAQALAALAAVADSVAAAAGSDDALMSQSPAPSQPLPPQPLSPTPGGGTPGPDAGNQRRRRQQQQQQQRQQQQQASAAAGFLAALRCDPASVDAFDGLRHACEARLQDDAEAHAAAAEGAALFLDMHLPGAAPASADSAAVAAAWRLLADATRAEAAPLQAAADQGDAQQAASPVWDTVAARSWWWPDLFFTSAAAESAVSKALAAQPQPGTELDNNVPAERAQTAATRQLAAQAVVAAFVQGPNGGAAGGGGDAANVGDSGQEAGSGGSGGFAALVARLCRQHANLSSIVDEVAEAMELAQAAACHQAAAAPPVPQRQSDVPMIVQYGADASLQPARASAAAGRDANDRLPALAAGMTGLKRSWWAAFPQKRRAATA